LILIIDDEEILRKRLKRLLELNDYEVVVAENGKHGLEVIREALPKIVLLDIKMPGIDGIEVLKRIKKDDSKYKETEVIMTTGHGSVDTAISAIQNGAFSYIQKPINIDELIFEIQKALDKIEMKEKLNEHVLELEKYRNHLEKLVQVRTEKLETSTEELQAANKKLEAMHYNFIEEQKMASEIFRKVVRYDDLQCSNVKKHLSSMDIFCGDLALSAPKPMGGLNVLVGDFTGHGLSAAIGAIPITDIFYTMTDQGFSICDIIKETNEKMKNLLPSNIFLCACFLELNLNVNTLTVWNGGLPDIIVMDTNSNNKKKLASKHLPLGILTSDKLDLSVEITEIELNDRVYVYSDGVIETSNSDGELYGQKRLEKFFQETCGKESVLECLKKELSDFRGNINQKDDITIVEIICNEWRAEYSEEILRKRVEEFPGWDLSLRFDAVRLKTTDIPSFIIKIIEEDFVMNKHKENIYLVIRELVNNALDYGILNIAPGLKSTVKGFEQFIEDRESALDELNEGWIKIDLQYFIGENKTQLLIKVEDSGYGFNYQQDYPDLSDNLSFGGRGIPLVNEICGSVSFHGNGSIVNAIYELK